MWPTQKTEAGRVWGPRVSLRLIIVFCVFSDSTGNELYVELKFHHKFALQGCHQLFWKRSEITLESGYCCHERVYD